MAGCVALVPAAGIGSRMAGATPKQYLPLAGRTLLEHAVDAFLQVDSIAQVAVVVSPADTRAAALPGLAHERVAVLPVGGASRRDTVLAGLEWLAGRHGDDTWTLVHDAARPGVRPAQIADLIEALRDDPVGGLLALPAHDTVKRVDGDGRIERTEPRAALWLAQTPQMFRLGTLRQALQAHADVTDEAQAIERMGLAARVLPGSRANAKVTLPEDLQWLRAWWEAR